MISPKIYDALKEFQSGPVHRSEGPTEMIRYLEDQKLIRTTKNDVLPELTIRPVEWQITVAGEAALSAFEQERNKEAEEKRHKKIQEQISVAQLLITLVSFILGLIVEHSTGIIGMISKLFR